MYFERAMVRLVSLALALSLMFVKVTVAEESWCYEVQACSTGCKGPRTWKDLDGECGGSNQSPINIVTKKVNYNPELRPFAFIGYNISYTFPITNNGHSAQIKLSPGIEILGGGLTSPYMAIQLHFHWGNEDVVGSEHTIDGERFPMELHIVHQKKYGRPGHAGDSDLAVLGFLYEESEEDNVNYKAIVDIIKSIPHKDDTGLINLALQDLIPEMNDLELYYRYQGSLTTPPCSEIVTWTLFPKTIKLSKNQIQAFYKSLNYHGGASMAENFRPLQKLGDRSVGTSDTRALLSKLCESI